VYPDPWEKVEDYQRVRNMLRSTRTPAGRPSGTNELPPGRVRGWLDGAKPDPVRGIETASRYGWLDPECDMAGALVELLAHPRGREHQRDVHPGDHDGRRTDRVRSGWRRRAVPARGQRWARNRTVPDDGRVGPRAVCLVAMGARTAQNGARRCPGRGVEEPAAIRKRFVEVYVAHRGVHFETKATTRVQEQRPASYLEDLRDLIDASVDGNVTVGDRAVTISADAARELGLS